MKLKGEEETKIIFKILLEIVGTKGKTFYICTHKKRKEVHF